MVHHTADAPRLLANVTNSEQFYHKALQSLLEASDRTLSSLYAYVNALTSPASEAVLTVIGSLRTADAALGRYTVALEGWRVGLYKLKELEEEVGIILRDREILVNRLVKASGKSFSKSTVGSPHSSMVNFGSAMGPKAAAAQAELQACEQTLAVREAELDVLRIKTLTEGIEARCESLVECAWTWGQMGNEGLAVLEDMTSITSEHVPIPSFVQSSPNRPSSVRSSALARSASQSSALSDTPPYTMFIPPAHSIGDIEYPVATPSTTRVGSPSSDDKHRVSVVAEESEDEEDPVQYHDAPDTMDTASPTGTTSAGGSVVGVDHRVSRSSSASASAAALASGAPAIWTTNSTLPRTRYQSQSQPEHKTSSKPGFFNKLFRRGSQKKHQDNERWMTQMLQTDTSYAVQIGPGSRSANTALRRRSTGLTHTRTNTATTTLSSSSASSSPPISAVGVPRSNRGRRTQSIDLGRPSKSVG